MLPGVPSRIPCVALQVGLLIMLSLLLRTAPAALLLRSNDLLLGGRKYSGPNRLPLLLWLINQTARWVFSAFAFLGSSCRILPANLLAAAPGQASEF